MKLQKPILFAIAAATIYGFAACGDGHDHAHGHDHDHKEATNKEGDSERDHDHDHNHDKILAGPNGGRVLTGIEPHAEFFVTKDRKVQVTFVDDDLKPIPAAKQTITVMAGDRSAPTKLSFSKQGEVLVSDLALPEGNLYPVSVMLKTDPDAKAVREKFNMNLTQCPDCPNKEYACTCEHEH